MKRSHLAIVGVATIAAIVVALLIVIKGSASPENKEAPMPRGSATAPGPSRERGSSGQADVADAMVASPSFLDRRTQAVVKLEPELADKILSCASGSAAPTPRAVRLRFAWRAEASAGQLQAFYVADASLIDVGGASPKSAGCVERLRGTPMMLDIAADQLPPDAREFEQIVQIPVP